MDAAADRTAEGRRTTTKYAAIGESDRMTLKFVKVAPPKQPAGKTTRRKVTRLSVGAHPPAPRSGRALAPVALRRCTPES